MVFWFTYTPEGQQAWMFSSAKVVGNRIIADPLLVTSGPSFGVDFNPDDLVFSEWGQLEIVFNDCNSGAYSYRANPEHGGFEGTHSIQRIIGVDGAPCDGPGTPLEPAISGNWYEQAHNGEGFLVQRLEHENSQVAVYWFTYDDDGNQVWLFNAGDIDNGQLVLDPLYETSGPSFGPGYEPDDLLLTEWGRLEFDFEDCEQAVANYQGPESVGSGGFDLERLTRVIGCNNWGRSEVRE